MASLRRLAADCLGAGFLEIGYGACITVQILRHGGFCGLDGLQPSSRSKTGDEDLTVVSTAVIFTKGASSPSEIQTK